MTCLSGNPSRLGLVLRALGDEHLTDAAVPAFPGLDNVTGCLDERAVPQHHSPLGCATPALGGRGHGEELLLQCRHPRFQVGVVLQPGPERL